MKIVKNNIFMSVFLSKVHLHQGIKEGKLNTGCEIRENNSKVSRITKGCCVW